MRVHRDQHLDTFEVISARVIIVKALVRETLMRLGSRQQSFLLLAFKHVLMSSIHVMILAALGFQIKSSAQQLDERYRLDQIRSNLQEQECARLNAYYNSVGFEGMLIGVYFLKDNRVRRFLNYNTSCATEDVGPYGKTYLDYMTNTLWKIEGSELCVYTSHTRDPERIERTCLNKK